MSSIPIPASENSLPNRAAGGPMRRYVLLVALIVTVGISVWANRQSNPDIKATNAPNTGTAGESRKAQSSADISVIKKTVTKPAQLLDRAVMQRVIGVVGEANPFAVKSWFVAPPPAPLPTIVAMVPPAPTAPPFPYVYAGKIDVEVGDGIKQFYYIANGDKQLTLSVGDTFENGYKFDAVEGNNLVIRYEPLGLRQYLPMNQN